MMKIVLIGADGQLGSDLVRILPSQDLIPLTEADLNITDRSRTAKLLKKYHPQVVINTAAYNDVDGSEMNKDQAWAVNAEGTRNVALAAKASEALLVHFSTDYVFDGAKKTPYLESDLPHPLSIYGASKAAGECFLQETLPPEQQLLIRTSGLFGLAGSKGKQGKNFVETMLALADSGKGELRVIHNQTISPTYTVDLARKTYELILALSQNPDRGGLYHVTNQGQCSWYEFAREIFALSGLKVNLKAVTSDEFKAPAQRPRYSVLENARLKKQGKDDLRPWQEALGEYLSERNQL